MTLPLSNNGEGGSNGTTVTTGNSGGGSGDAWDGVTIGAGGALIFDNTHAEGTLAYKISTPATSVNVLVEWTSTTIGTQTTLFCRVYLYLLAAPAGQALHLIKFRDGSTEVGAVIIQTAGTIALRDKNGAISGAMSTSVPTGQWVRIGATIVCNASTGSIEAKLFSSADSAIATETLTKTNRNTGTQVTNVRFGETSVSGTITARDFWIDDMQANATGYPGTARTTVALGGLGSAVPAAVAAVPSATPAGTAVAGPSTAPTSAAISTPDVQLGAQPTPAVVAALAAMPAPALAAAARPSTTTAAALATAPTPGLIVGGDPHPNTVAAVAAIASAGVHASTAGVEGWGGPWGDMPWGGIQTPGIGGRPLIGRDEFPGELPPFEHRIIGPNGLSDSPPVVHGFAADEDVGFATLQGVVEAERVRDQPDIYTDGAKWIVTDSSTGLIVAAGDLLTPSIGAGVAALKADGWAKRLLRHGERLMYAVQGNYGGTFVPKNSEPYGGDGMGFYVQGEDRFQVSADGALRWHLSKGTDSWDDGDRQGFIGAFIGLRPGVIRVKGHIHCTRDGPNFKFRAATADDQVGPLHGFVDIHDFTAGGTDFDFDIDLTEPGPILCIEARRQGTGTTTQDIDMIITGLVTYGIASDDRWSASDVGRDIAGRLGFATRIKESSLNVLPLDAGPDGVYADPLDMACLLSGMYYRVLGIDPATPVLEMRHNGSVRWEIIDPEFPVDPVPLPRFDSVLVPYTLSNGVAQGILEVTADAIDQPRLPLSRAYGPVSLPDPLPNEDNARLLGQQLLRRVYPPRFAGTATFSRVYGNDGIATAHEVHSQDTIVLPLNGGMALVTKGLRRQGGSVEATFDDGALSADRLVARKSRQILLRSPK